MSTTPELLTPALQQVDTDAITFFTKNGVSNKIAAQDLKKDFGGISYIPSVQEAVGVAAKTASGGPVNLAAGITIEVCFTNGNSAANPTLNYNNTGAKSIMIMKGGNKVAASINPMDAGTILRVRYDGTDWVICGNPVVKTTNDYTSYADGNIVYNKYIKSTIFNDFNNVNIIDNMFGISFSNYRPSNAPDDNNNYWYCMSFKSTYYNLNNIMQIAIGLNNGATYVRVTGASEWHLL